MIEGINTLFKDNPNVAVLIPYNDQYQLVLMDGKVIVMGKGIEKSYDNPADALDYVGLKAPDGRKEKTTMRAKSSVQYTGDDTGDDEQSEDPSLITNRGGRDPGDRTDAAVSDSEALADIEALVQGIDLLAGIRPSHPEYQTAIDELNAKYAALADIGAEIIGSIGSSKYKIIRYRNRKYVVGNGISDTGYIVAVEGEGKYEFHVLGNDIDIEFTSLDDVHNCIYNLLLPLQSANLGQPLETIDDMKALKDEYDDTGDRTIAVDIIARAIYGEQTRTKDNGQEAVAWTMINRRNQPGQTYYGWDYTDIVLAESQYTAMYQESNNMQSYKPNTSNPGWENAVRLATLMVADGTRNVNIENKIGYGTQYRATKYFRYNHRRIDGQDQFYTGGRWHNVSDVHNFNGNTFFNFID